MKSKLIPPAIAAGLLLAGAAPAQPPADLIPDYVTIVDDLVVRAYGGPPWWIVSDADTKIYILASPRTLPPGVTWDKTLLNKRLTGANELIMPTTNAGIPLLSRAKTKRLSDDINHSSKTDLEPSLPPDVRARFVRLRTAIGKPETRYGALNPGLAGMALAGDYRRRANDSLPPMPGLTFIEPEIVKAAKAKRVKVAPAKVYRGHSAFISEVRLPGLACLNAQMDEIEKVRPADLKALDYMGRSWADGDIRPILEAVRRNPPSIGAGTQLTHGTDQLNILATAPACLNAMPSQARVYREWKDDMVNPIVRALGKPGHAVAVLPAGPLLMRDGVLDRLQRRGFTITTPDRAGE